MSGYLCPTCYRPIRFVAEYQRWYCDQCRQYPTYSVQAPPPSGAVPAWSAPPPAAAVQPSPAAASAPAPQAPVPQYSAPMSSAAPSFA
ncbi:MAG TPA: hypothetical protein VI893_06660, partial [Thermoplasmata archaeon]|nr:hypothetical protein [Thermoplasmata archaeon]